ncbi:MAG TPA: alanine--tRNA ligase [Nanoarchaeota archaeon]|nr:alanine--tRNA ligase [Nanoarchaeota archaeon]
MKPVKTRQELIKLYIDFFKSKQHKEVPNSPLIPQNDPTVLFTTAGMHPLVPYLLGQKHPLGKRLCSVQRCIRTNDIDSVGDRFHNTFFEMLGNWSLGDYFKSESIEYSFEFLTKTLGIPPDMIAVTCFKGDKDAPIDKEAAERWKNLGLKEDRIAFLSKEDNWWNPPGQTGPCGPDTEIFFWVGTGKPHGNPGVNPKEWAEIWNNVFMQYEKREDGSFAELKQKNVDTGMGIERTLAILNKCESVHETNMLFPLIQKQEHLSGKKYGNEPNETKSMRIIADHIRASVMILAEKKAPSNVEQGYVLRRLIRRAIRHARLIGIEGKFTKAIAEEVFPLYPDYSYLEANKAFILTELEKEEERFSEVLEKGIRYFARLKETIQGKVIDGKTAFLLYQSFGFPIEMTQELARENNLEVDIIGYEQEQAMHQELSRTATEGKFKSGLADNSEATTRLHTTAHLMLAALRQVLGGHVEQRGSNITAERIRFDFSHDEKLTPKQLKEVERIVNDNIKNNLDVKREEMTVDEAKKTGAMGVFEHKYGEKVSVYTICDPNNIVSREICAGPHVTNTKEIGRFKIQKEEASSKGVRRIKAILE